jgi:hypothetical protein
MACQIQNAHVDFRAPHASTRHAQPVDPVDQCFFEEK